MTDAAGYAAAGSEPRAQIRPTRIPIAPRVTDAASDAATLASRVSQVARGGARAAVLGVNDGLVTNICLILAVAGADASASNVRLAGFASLVAGALSMAAGEWVSVRSQVELYSGALDELRTLVARNPKLILDELSTRLEAAGFGRETAQIASTELPLDEPRFLRFTATTLFGLNPDELGSPSIAAASSLSLFAAGALVPLIPWSFTSGGAATGLSILLTAAASLLVGGVVSRSGGRSVGAGAARQLAIVVAAAAVTYGIGKLFGTTII
ncbi:MAG TPA: VIT1/CCC1 transporter family protein [Acidimicrobiales bacterium]|nr:VIT1/CCC1 transporter family protein [Acidimicrobiales bacterium]